MPKPVKTEERLDKHERQIAAIRELVHEGMRLVIRGRKDIRALNAAQIRTETPASRRSSTACAAATATSTARLNTKDLSRNNISIMKCFGVH